MASNQAQVLDALKRENERLDRRNAELEHEAYLRTKEDRETVHRLREALAYIAVLEAERLPITPRDDRPDPLYEDEAKERRNPSRDPYEAMREGWRRVA